MKFFPKTNVLAFVIAAKQKLHLHDKSDLYVKNDIYDIYVLTKDAGAICEILKSRTEII